MAKSMLLLVKFSIGYINCFSHLWIAANDDKVFEAGDSASLQQFNLDSGADICG
jgi:hypothetical protein